MGRRRKYHTVEAAQEAGKLSSQKYRDRKKGAVAESPVASVSSASQLRNSAGSECHHLQNISTTGCPTLPHYSVPYHHDTSTGQAQISRMLGSPSWYVIIPAATPTASVVTTPRQCFSTSSHVAPIQKRFSAERKGLGSPAAFVSPFQAVLSHARTSPIFGEPAPVCATKPESIQSFVLPFQPQSSSLTVAAYSHVTAIQEALSDARVGDGSGTHPIAPLGGPTFAKSPSLSTSHMVSTSKTTVPVVPANSAAYCVGTLAAPTYGVPSPIHIVKSEYIQSPVLQLQPHSATLSVTNSLNTTPMQKVLSATSTGDGSSVYHVNPLGSPTFEKSLCVPTSNFRLRPTSKNGSPLPTNSSAYPVSPLVSPTLAESPPISNLCKRSTSHDAAVLPTKKSRKSKHEVKTETVPPRRSTRIQAIETTAAAMRQVLENAAVEEYRNPKLSNRIIKGKQQFKIFAAACPMNKQYNNFYVAMDVLSVETLQPHSLGGFFEKTCRYCAAYYFPGEVNSKGLYSNCCLQGKIHIDIPAYPQEFRDLLDVAANPNCPLVKNFRDHIRNYNNMFAFASFGFKADDVPGNGPYVFKIHGQTRHRIGSLHPNAETDCRKYSQLHMVDTDEANRQRLGLEVNEGTRIEILDIINNFLKEHNPFAKSLLMMREVEKRAKEEAKRNRTKEPVELQLYINSDFDLNPEQYRKRKLYNLPAANEVAIIFNSKDGAPPEFRHVAVHPRPKDLEEVRSRFNVLAINSKSSPLVTLFPTNARIDALTYPLLFPYGEFGWQKDMFPYIPTHERKIVDTGIAAGTGFHPPALHVAADAEVDIDEGLDELREGCFEGSVADNEEEEDVDVGELEVGDGCDRESGGRNSVTFFEHAKYRIHPRVGHEVFLYCGKLFQQYGCDLYSRVLAYRLHYVKTHQRDLRVELYSGLRDHLSRSAHNANVKMGTMIILPSTFIGSPRNMHQNYLDAMAVVTETSKPDFFLTMTCNPRWPEIQSALRGEQEPWEVPGIICRVFYQKVKHLIDLLTKQHVFGHVEAFNGTIEFQKRGLPHLHLLLIMKESHKPKTAEDVDRFVSAMLPLKDLHPDLYDIVTSCMIHSPCTDKTDGCRSDKGGCSKKFPKTFTDETVITKDGFPEYKRPDNRGTCTIISKKGKEIAIDNSWVVPYNPFLLKIFNCHINVEICSSIKSVKYIYKYVYKGFDRVVYRLRVVTLKSGVKETVMDLDEVDDWVDGRYLSAIEGIWRLHGFPIHFRSHAVERLPIHLEEGHSVIFGAKAEQEELQELVRESVRKGTKLTAFFDLCKTDAFAATLLYKDVPKFYVYKRVEDKSPSNVCSVGNNVAPNGPHIIGREVGKKNGSTKKQYANKWVRRSGKRGKPVIGRITYTGNCQQELSCLRALLLHRRGPKGYDDIITIDGVKFKDCYAAALHLGLVESNDYFRSIMKEGVEIKMAGPLRQLFVDMVLFNKIRDASVVYEEIKDDLSDDIVYKDGLDRERANLRALLDIKQMLQAEGKSLSDIGLPDAPDDHLDKMPNNVTMDFRNGVKANCKQLNTKQKLAVQAILLAVERFHEHKTKDVLNFSDFIDIPRALRDKHKSNLIYLDGPAGSGKTFVYNTVIGILKCLGLTYICVAPTGLAASLLDGGRTVHSKFKVSLNTNNGTVANIKAHEEPAAEIRNSSLLIWDEISMCGKYLLECVSKCYQDVHGDKRYEKFPFSFVPVICGGDFRQQPPVIKDGGRAACRSLCVKGSWIWDHFQIISLEKNMRAEGSDIRFHDWLVSVGNGTEGCLTRIENSHLVKSCGRPVALVDEIFGCNISAIPTKDLAGRAILCSKNEDADDINNMVLARLDGQEQISYSVDTAKPSNSMEALEFPEEFLHTLKLSGMPPHELRLKKNCVIMLLRNMNCNRGLCNGTRLIVREIRTNVLMCDIISGSHVGEPALIPKVKLVPSDTGYNFVFERYQFPVKLSYSMTVHKSQGQSFDYVGLYLKSEVFTHGQLYTALSRVKNKENLKIDPCDNYVERNGSIYIKNIVYPEMLNKSSPTFAPLHIPKC